MKDQPDQQDLPNSSYETAPKVMGIGGIFFFSENPDKTKDWYAQNLGLDITDWGGSVFESRNIDNPDTKEALIWSPFPAGSEYFAPSNKEFMINYRVQNIEGFVQQLREKAVTILDEITEHDQGKFVHILDAEGTKIELWEP